jgi:N-acetylglucosamine-6-phosphate deacetylase
MIVLANARVVTAGRVIEGWVGIEGERIVAVDVGPEPARADAVVDLDGLWLVPGFVDLHVHGGGGASVGDGGDALRRVLEFHQQHGTARLVASVAAGPMEQMGGAVAEVADAVHGGARHLAGSHLEGPFLEQSHCGALDSSWFLAPDAGRLDQLLGAGRRTVRVVTIAPGLPGSDELIRRVAGAGAVAAMGHSGAGYDDAIAAVEAGVTLATHTFNAMAPWHHRAPGIAGAALDRNEVVCEVIADGVHLHEAVLRLIFAAKGASRVALVTDAIAAAGSGDGDYRLGTRTVRVSGDRAELVADGRLAGSVLTMDRALRVAVRAGVPFADAVVAATATPARVLGIDDRAGAIAPGYCADLVALDDDHMVAAVIMDGRLVRGLAGLGPTWS